MKITTQIYSNSNIGINYQYTFQLSAKGWGGDKTNS